MAKSLVSCFFDSRCIFGSNAPFMKKRFLSVGRIRTPMLVDDCLYPAWSSEPTEVYDVISTGMPAWSLASQQQCTTVCYIDDDHTLVFMKNIKYTHRAMRRLE